VILDRLVLGLLPTAVALVHLLPRPEPERTFVFTYAAPGEDPGVSLSPPYPLPWLTASRPLIAALGIALLVAVVLSWRAARSHPEPALATALVLVSVGYPLAWVLHGYAIWPQILLPLGVAAALTLRAAKAAAIESSPHDLRQGRRPRQA
jgi:hypothetical protein